MSGTHQYLVALGSNERHRRFGSPERVVREAGRQMSRLGEVLALAPVAKSAPIGPSRRRYANGAAVLVSDLPPPELLKALKRLEREFGRRTGGQRWSARVLDCDIIFWNGGAWHDPTLTIPHPMCRQRRFVLQPAAMIAPEWRDPATGIRIRHLLARLTKPQPVLRWAAPDPAGYVGP
ncbi:2-amino-4-hydroxy-6-hydroxymethyldihydropteridine diphosphokinase [Porphyrobacter sp. GA68]|uniref:2-amino-4-hydroxy-6- hydroxymethyldihydropteridine diphosphokinase n=1 Tax=Porphyrobacter sp. GA68 TaxID=2883480 RepID=UPI001D194238|nr:2-amino-4-hydroxy-6-hydroxymethyldihydropteridine diphosphokinase [Porphyrobacter sp. GA68]